ncbi:hypothetical protein KOI35_46825 [Actinoplanes bogorensis]|uniref:Uncharacterized protein n=1 Tax=Paractinoplanes bogorensis TaxID=1610840 RepID=A0ABS5Z5S6_9ACTN|nr:hypothetical protein [Actinoplanes bogorensis]MBU2671037.1 hypothetical protein [Actinoplanes bogorensis]
MMRRDVLTQLREGGVLPVRDHHGTRMSDMHIELDPSEHEEPTWEVRRAPGPGKKKRLDRRTRLILGVAAAMAVVVNAGAAWAYWRITGSEVAASDGAPVELTLRARSDLNKPLTPGSNGDLVVTLTNDNGFPVKITSLTAGGVVTADDAHAQAGCKITGVQLSKPSFDVMWEVGANAIGAFKVRSGLTMRQGIAKACDGAVFTVPVRVHGVRQESS